VEHRQRRCCNGGGGEPMRRRDHHVLRVREVESHGLEPLDDRADGAGPLPRDDLERTDGLDGHIINVDSERYHARGRRHTVKRRQ
jgi:hypothetical protein